MKTFELTVLFLGGARRVSFAQLLKESGEKLGVKINIVSYDLSEEVPVSLEAKVVKGLKWDDKDIISDLSKVIAEYKVKVILPIVNGAIEIASICKELFPELFVPVTDFNTARVLFDKVEAAKAFKDADLPIPRTYSVLSAVMPAIAKPRKGSRSRGIQIFYDMEDLMHLQNLQDYIIQEYIEHKKEYTVDAYVDSKGEILVSVPRERLEIMGGESTRTITVRNEFLENLTKTVIEKFNLRGPVNIQFLYDPENDRYLLSEVNPRLGGAVICSILAGAPITDYIIKEALGEPLKKCEDWKSGTLLARYLKEAVFFK